MTTEDAAPDGALVSAERRHRNRLAWFLLGVLPLSALLAFIVVQVMASAAASATGGCGGG